MIRWKYLIGLLVIVIILSITMFATTDDILEGITLGLDLQGGFEILYQAHPIEEGGEVTEDSLKQTAVVINERVDGMGVSEPDIKIEDNNRIRVKLAGVHDPDSARELIGKTASLTFRNPNNEVLLDGTDLVPGGAKADYDEYGFPVVVLKLKDADKFYNITKEYTGQPIGIYLDEERITNPTVNQPISGGTATITGQETLEEAQDLANLLNAGALPLELEEIHSRSVGATLGMKALDLAVKAGIIGAVLILLYMIFYYRIPGIIASYSLIVYIYLVLFVFSELHVTLTLPGIAALILGIGMAVDANIITYERIKEELKSGKSLLSSVRSGSKRSLSTILDANITTIIAALVLFIFGTSSVQGFGITLIVSILVSLFTAIFGARYLLNLFVKSNLVTKPWGYGVKEEEISEL